MRVRTSRGRLELVEAGLPDRIRAARTRAGFPSAASLARAIGAAEATVLRWERGDHLPSGSLLEEVADACEVPIRWLAGGAEHDRNVPGSSVQSNTHDRTGDLDDDSEAAA